jgi:nitroreductase
MPPNAQKKETKDFNEPLRWRYATKQFDTAKKVSEEDLKDILDSARLSASSMGLQPWKFVVVKDPKVRQDLRKVSWGQAQVTDASHLIVLCRLKNVDEKLAKKHLENTAKTANIPIAALKGYEDMITGFLKSKTKEQLADWAARQIYIALGTMMYTCALKKIDSCPMEGFDQKKCDEILNLGKDGLESVCLLPVGYRAEEDKYAKQPKTRFPFNEVVVNKG